MILVGKIGCFGGLKRGFCCQLLSDFWNLTTIGSFVSKKKHRKYKGFLCFEFESLLTKIQYLVRQRSRVQVPSSAPFFLQFTCFGTWTEVQHLSVPDRTYVLPALATNCHRQLCLTRRPVISSILQTKTLL